MKVSEIKATMNDLDRIRLAEKALTHALKSHLGDKMKPLNENGSAPNKDKDALETLFMLRARLAERETDAR